MLSALHSCTAQSNFEIENLKFVVNYGSMLVLLFLKLDRIMFGTKLLDLDGQRLRWPKREIVKIAFLSGLVFLTSG